MDVTTRNVFASGLLATALLSGQALAEGTNSTEQLGVFGSTQTGYIQLYAFDQFDDFSYVQLELYTNSSYVYCNGLMDPADILQTTGSTAAVLDVTAVLGELDCSGVAPTTLSGTCSDNGDWHQENNGVTHGANAGGRFSYHGNTKTTSVDCTLDVDGVSYPAEGSISSGINKNK